MQARRRATRHAAVVSTNISSFFDDRPRATELRQWCNKVCDIPGAVNGERTTSQARAATQTQCRPEDWAESGDCSKVLVASQYSMKVSLGAGAGPMIMLRCSMAEGSTDIRANVLVSDG